MPSTKTPVGRPTAETIRSWRTLEDAPVLTPLAMQRRTLREQRRLLMAREQERLAAGERAPGEAATAGTYGQRRRQRVSRRSIPVACRMPRCWSAREAVAGQYRAAARG